MRRLLLALAVVFLSWAQGPPNRLMLLVIGKSAAHPDADQMAVLRRVQGLRANPALQKLQVATMHFDRPREARFAQQYLGVNKAMLPCVVLVQMDEAGQRPQKTLQTWSNLTAERLEQIESMGEAWAQMAGQPLPMFTPQAAPTPLAPPPLTPPREQQTERAPDRVLAGVSLRTDSWLRSPNGVFALCFQYDGNLVLYRVNSQPFQVLWSSNTANSGASVLRLGNDGVLRLSGASGQSVWEAGTASYFSHAYLQVQDDGNLVLYRQNGDGVVAAWASNSVQRLP